MATGHRVHKLRAPRGALPKEVEPIGPRAYRDRFGWEYTVIWNGHHSEPYLFQLGQSSSSCSSVSP